MLPAAFVAIETRTQAHENLAHGIASAFLAGAVFATLSLIVTLVFVNAPKPPTRT